MSVTLMGCDSLHGQHCYLSAALSLRGVTLQLGLLPCRRRGATLAMITSPAILTLSPLRSDNYPANLPHHVARVIPVCSHEELNRAQFPLGYGHIGVPLNAAAI